MADPTDELSLPETIIRGTPSTGGSDGTDSSPGILQTMLMSAKKLPGQTVGGIVDGINTVLGGYANIVQAIRGQDITRQIGEGLVPNPVGGSQQLNDLVGLPSQSSGLLEDSTSAVLGALNPVAVIGKVAGVSKALIVAATSAGASSRDIELAQKFLNAGADPATVFENLGVYKGPGDGIMRSVINDNSSQINTDVLTRTTPLGNTRAGGYSGPERPVISVPGGDGVQLDDLLGHPQLFDIYPELKDVTVVRGNQGLNEAAAYNGRAGSRIEMGPFLDLDELHSALLHEVQHVIQYNEGMAAGSNPSAFLSPGFNASLTKIQSIAADLKSSLADKFGVSKDTIAQYAIAPQNAPKDIVATDDFQTYIKTRNAQAIAGNAKANAFSQYERTFGEAEARSVQSAFDLDQSDGVFFPPDLYMNSKGTQYLPVSDLLSSPFDAPIKGKPKS